MPAEIARTSGLAVGALAVGVAGAFLHGWAKPLGMVLAVGAVVGLMVLCRRGLHSRVAIAVVALAWLAPVIALAQQRPEGDVVIPGDELGLIFLFGGVLCLGVTLGIGSSAGKVRGFE